jgi:hypothetical protein
MNMASSIFIVALRTLDSMHASANFFRISMFGNEIPKENIS